MTALRDASPRELGTPVAIGTGAAIVRPAAAADDAARRALFARVAMEGDLGLTVCRDPDFDALYRMQACDWESWVVELDGRVEGTGTVLVRDGYLGGARRRIGYLGDLRFSPRAEGRMLLDRWYGPILRGAAERLGCELFLTAIIASNARALRALTVSTARAARAGRPRYTPLMDFDIRSLHLLPPRWRARSAGSVRVRRATDADVPALAHLLDADARARPFGEPMDERELRRRLAEWPGLAAQWFYVACQRDGALVGCLALWDAAPVKRLVVTAYRGRMRRVRTAYDVGARLLGRAPLPAPGDAFRYQYVTHQAVPSGDPTVLRALLDAAYRDARRAGYHFLSVCAPAADPLAPALRRFAATSLPARLYLVTLPETEIPAACFGGRAGFEMALV